MAKKKYVVDLTEAERTELKELIASGESKARKITRARILLKAEQDKVDEEIAEALETSVSTVERVRRCFVESGLPTSLNRRQPRRNYEGKLDGKAEAHLVALACRPPPSDTTGGPYACWPTNWSNSMKWSWRRSPTKQCGRC